MMNECIRLDLEISRLKSELKRSRMISVFIGLCCLITFLSLMSRIHYLENRLESQTELANDYWLQLYSSAKTTHHLSSKKNKEKQEK